MFEFMYAKKIKKDIVMEIIDKYIDDYYMSISHKPNGNTEIFIGSKKNDSEKYIEDRLNNYNNLLKSGILDCVTEKSQESEEKH